MPHPVFPPVTNFPINKKKNLGFCKLLFETPSGFAIFSFDMRYLHKDIEDTWTYFVGNYWHYLFLKMHTFRRFEDKSDAINLTTRRVGPRMISLICKYCLPGELIIVGSLEYKSILQENLRRACSYNDIVREIMWGMQNLMPLLIPQEQSVFTKADRLPICKGLDMLLSRHGIDNVKQEWINEDILQLALKVYHVDLRENEHSKFLRRSLGLDKHLKAISGFDVKDWDLVKLATALKTMVDPNANLLPLDKAFKMFSREEAELIELDAPKYEDLLDRDTISEIYDDIVAFREYVDKVLLKLRHLLKKAEEALETEEQQRHVTSGANGEEVIATNKDTPAVSTTQDVAQAQVKDGGMHTNNGDGGGQAEATDLSIDEDEDQQHITGTTQDVAQHAKTQAQEIDAEQIMNAQVKNGGMHTNNGDGGEQTDGDITGGGGGQADEVADLSKSSGRTCTEKTPGEGGKQAEVTVVSKSVERTSTENKEIVADEDITGLADPNKLHEEQSRTGLNAEQSKDKRTSAKVASPTKQGSVEGTVQNNDDGRKCRETTSLLSLLSMELPQQTQTMRRSESMTGSHAQDFRGRESKAETSWSGPLAQRSIPDSPPAPSNPDSPPAPSNPETVRSKDSLPVYQPRSGYLPPFSGSKDRKASHLPSLASGSRPPLAGTKDKKTSTNDAELSKDKKTSTKDAESSVKAGSRDKKTKDAGSPVKAVPPETSSVDPEAARPDQSFSFRKTFGLTKKQH